MSTYQLEVHATMTDRIVILWMNQRQCLTFYFSHLQYGVHLTRRETICSKKSRGYRLQPKLDNHAPHIDNVIVSGKKDHWKKLKEPGIVTDCVIKTAKVKKNYSFTDCTVLFQQLKGQLQWIFLLLTSKECVITKRFPCSFFFQNILMVFDIILKHPEDQRRQQYTALTTMCLRRI